uniref:Capsid protein n=1 Tax=Cruciviridae sp. TaxID=1955495 RepID=A0A1S6LVJ9_9VIRU|nr:capsid protein [Cruciviridae sp.]
MVDMEWVGDDSKYEPTSLVVSGQRGLKRSRGRMGTMGMPGVSIPRSGGPRRSFFESFFRAPKVRAGFYKRQAIKNPSKADYWNRRAELVAQGLGAYRKGAICRGRGGFFGDVFSSIKSAIPKGSFQKLGSMVGNKFGGGFGDKIGSYLGGQAARKFGFGAYSSSGGDGGAMVGSGSLPEMVNTAEGTIIRHREYIGDVYTGTNVAGTTGGPSQFNITTFAVNPGLQATFPWGAGVAINYQEWEPRGIIFEFKTTSSDSNNVSSSSINLGSVIMANDYNVLNPVFTNKQEMENTEAAGSCKPSQSMTCELECDPKYNPMGKYFVRNGLVNVSDLRFNDLCNFSIATVNIPTGASGISIAIGELWMTYEIKLLKPIQPSVTGTNLVSSHLAVSGSISSANGTPVPLAGTGSAQYIVPAIVPALFLSLTGEVMNNVGFYAPVNGGAAANGLPSIGSITAGSLFQFPNVPQGKKYQGTFVFSTWEAKNDTIIVPGVSTFSGWSNSAASTIISAGVSLTGAPLIDQAYASNIQQTATTNSLGTAGPNYHTLTFFMDTLSNGAPVTGSFVLGKGTLGSSSSAWCCTDFYLTELNTNISS